MEQSYTETEVDKDNADFLYLAIKTYLEGGQSSEVRDLLKADENKDKLKVKAWDLASMFTLYIDQFTYETGQGVYEVALEGIKVLLELGKPKEMLLAMLEQCDSFNDDTKYCNLLPLIQTCLLKMGKRNYRSVAVAMETLYAHILGMELPSHDLEGEERMLLANDAKVKRVCEITSALISFTEPFCIEVKKLRENNELKLSSKLGQELTRYILKFLEHPLAYLEVFKVEESEGVCFVMALDAMAMFNKVQPNVHSCVQKVEQENVVIKKATSGGKKSASGDGEQDYNLMEPYSELGVAMYVYLAYSQGMADDNIPQVFTALYMYEFCNKYAVFLIHNSENIIIHKGLVLLQSSMERIETQTIPYDYVESEYVKDTVSAISQIAISCSDSSCRKLAVQLFPTLLDKFSVKGRNNLLKYLINSSSNGGIVGYAIHLVKQEIEKSLASSIPSEYFVGQPLAVLLHCVFALPDGVVTDILQQRDRILAALNLLRFLLIRDDPAQNVTGIWDLLPELEKSYVDPLRTGIRMSKSQYAMELQHLREQPEAKGHMDFTVAVRGIDIPALTKKQQKEVLETGHVNLDMVESVLGRVSELMDAKQAQRNK